MSAAPVDRRRSTLIAAALFVSALALVSLRTIKSARLIESVKAPSTDFSSLSAFFHALPDTSVLVRAATGAMVVTRDPFVPTTVARAQSPTQARVEGTHLAAKAVRHWVVSTILFEASKKSALVNNKWVTAGDLLGDGSRLTSVERDHIVVTDSKGIRHIVPIQGGESK